MSFESASFSHLMVDGQQTVPVLSIPSPQIQAGTAQTFKRLIMRPSRAMTMRQVERAIPSVWTAIVLGNHGLLRSK